MYAPTNQRRNMHNVALLATMKAKPGKEETVSEFLKSALELARQEETTLSWFAFRIDESSFGIFDTFEDDNGRQAHLNGEIAKQLMAGAEELLSEPPVTQPVDVLAAK